MHTTSITMQKWILEFLKILRIHENKNKTSQNFPTIVLPIQSIPISNQSHNRNNSQLLFRKSCHLPSNLLHLDNSGTDQLLDLVHHTRVLGMFLCSLRIFLEINQYLHTKPTIINTSYCCGTLYTIIMQPRKKANLSHNRVLKNVLNLWIWHCLSLRNIQHKAYIIYHIWNKSNLK